MMVITPRSRINFLALLLVGALGTAQAFEMPQRPVSPVAVWPLSAQASSRRAFLQSVTTTTTTTTTSALVATTSLASWTSSPSKALAAPPLSVGGPPRYGDESIMSPKAHGTSNQPVQENLLYGVSRELADRICNYNRHFAEFAGYFKTTDWEDKVLASASPTKSGPGEPVVFYDSVTGKPLFVAPMGRTAEELLTESSLHGWPSFRDNEVIWDNVRVLPNGETVSVDGTHLGHNLPDRKGNRYCINLVSIAGQPVSAKA